MGEMTALAEPGQSWRDEAVATRLHQRGHFLPAPAGRPGAMHDDECGHLSSPIYGRVILSETRFPLFGITRYSAATVRSFRLFKRARIASISTTANPAA